MNIPHEVKKWMKTHSIYDLEEYLLDEKLSKKAEEILRLLEELNQEEIVLDSGIEEALS
ncbi:MAG: hypothetical protein ACP5JT_00385 [Thermoplasmata archaeon]|jgi:hypothetical protein